ncbi:hypothetical protein R5R35_000483 [Gryllus longicercus]|uniref:Dehydrogenase/reductase SDR family protein 7-like n=1 Tax=Gryllus longicercus TaxID=2509291 RepID=A0AAN9V9P3_9ORTH
MKQLNEKLLGYGWPIIWRFMGTLCVPLTILPWLIYHIIGQRKDERIKILKDKVVLITGASSGLGEALAHAFYSAGCKIILAARREKELERVKESLMVSHATGTTHPPVVLPLDVSDINNIPQYVTKALAIHGHIDILVNNAGMSYRGTVLNTNIDVDIKLMLINYFGQVALTKALLPSMVERSCGHIVAVSSVQGLMAIPFRSAYAASKHALQAFCDTVRSEVADHDVQVTVVSPGYIRTSLSLNALTGDGKTYGMMDASTAGGYSPEYVADQVVQAVVDKKAELVLAPFAPRVAIFLRCLVPRLYFWIMQKRARSEAKKTG